MSTVHRLATTTALLALALLALPLEAWGCAVCFDTTAENRVAFLQTTVALSLLPLGMVGGFGYWLKKRAGEVSQEAERPDEGSDQPS